MQNTKPLAIHPALRSAIRKAMEQANRTPTKNVTKQSLRLSPGLTMLVTPALRDQIDRFAAEEKVSRAKVIRRSLYDYMRNPKQFEFAPSASLLPKPMLPPDRPLSLSWTMPNKEDRELFEAMAKGRKMKPTALARRVVYMYTRSHISTDKEEAIQATADAWL